MVASILHESSSELGPKRLPRSLASPDSWLLLVISLDMVASFAHASGCCIGVDLSL